jgi:hypothetical protein
MWLFGDTFFMQPAADGLTWRSSSWSWTDQTDASGGLAEFTHALDPQGKPLQAIPNTADEQAFNVAHSGNPCPAGSSCGVRHTPWPAGAFVVDPETGAAWVSLLIVVAVVFASWFVIWELEADSKMQDCVWSGRKNCAPVDTDSMRGVPTPP